jgi:hypothetical protein
VSIYLAFAEAFSPTTLLSQQDKGDWRERIKDWRGNAFYKKALLPALLVMRAEEVDYRGQLPKATCNFKRRYLKYSVLETSKTSYFPSLSPMYACTSRDAINSYWYLRYMTSKLGKHTSFEVLELNI